MYKIQSIKRVQKMQNQCTIELSNKKVTDLRQALTNILRASSPSRFIELVASENSIVDLDGIQLVAEGLVSAKLHNNQIRSVKGISNLHFPKLEKLYLEFNRINELNGLQLSTFPNLIRLSLNSNTLTSACCSVLSNLNAPELRILSLQNNQISEIKFVEDLKTINLIDINLSHNQIVDIQPFSKCIFAQKLSKLELQNNRIASIPNLGHNMGNLRKFVLSNNRITTVQGLMSCSFPLLEILEIESNLISCLRFLERTWMPKLVDLKLNNNKITRLPVRELRYGTFPLLEQLLLKNNEIKSGRIEDLRTPFADVRELRQNLLPIENGVKVCESPKVQVSQRDTVIRTKEMKKESYNDNRVMSMISLWRNRLIVIDGKGVYTRMKSHFPHLSFLEF